MKKNTFFSAALTTVVGFGILYLVAYTVGAGFNAGGN